MKTSIKLAPLITSWQKLLSEEFSKPYFTRLLQFLNTQAEQGVEILPPQKDWFNALNSTPAEQVKVVILGQDPYPTPGHAHGLCFSVLPDVQPIPKSLKNIFKELQDDLQIQNELGHLQNWATQGVLLLNSVLTVEKAKANAHQGKGWEIFTDEIISQINDFDRPIVFVLWGTYAQKKGNMINEKKHLVIRSPHPSPLAAYRGFFGSKPFSQINAFLKQQGLNEIDWTI